MKEVLLLKLGEIVLKGLNRNTFENALIKNIRRRLAPLGEFEVRMAQSTITVTPGEGADFEGAVERAVSYTHLDVYKRQVLQSIVV